MGIEAESRTTAIAPIEFGTDGWRGVIADDFTFENVGRVSRARAKAAQPGGCVLSWMPPPQMAIPPNGVAATACNASGRSIESSGPRGRIRKLAQAWHV
jgi:hypothetical protein